MRLFLAVTFASEDLLLLADAQQIIAQNSSKAALVKKDNLHLTLHFLGELARQDADRLVFSLPSLDPCLFNDLQYRFAGYDYFHRNDGKLIFADLEASSNMYKMQKELGSLLKSLGFSISKRRWKPHITLSRRTELLSPWREIEAKLPLQTNWHYAAGVKLFQSEFTSKGMKYTPLLEL